MCKCVCSHSGENNAPGGRFLLVVLVSLCVCSHTMCILVEHDETFTDSIAYVGQGEKFHYHIFKSIVWHISFVEHINSQLLQIVVVALLTLTLSFVVSLTFGFTPLGNAVVGWHKK